MRALSKRHYRQLVKESGIRPEIVEQRGYRTIKDVAELRALGYRRVGMTPPGLLIPLCPPPPSGEGGGEGRGPVIFRPDTPWRLTDRRGRVEERRYNPPRRDRNYLDVHPSMQDALDDTDRAVFIVEGHKKADAATSRGLLTIGLSGVDSWRYWTRDALGRRDESVPCDEWDHFPLNRRFVIVYDSDYATNPRVAGARDRLARFLYRRGATRVSVANLPAARNGAKNGLDDWFVAGGQVADLHALSEPVPEPRAAS